MTQPLTAVILTYNEAKHIVACVQSCQRLTTTVLVVDSGSTDNTQALATQAGAQVVVHPFENYAAQRNYALAQVGAGWVLFVDADERLSDESVAEVRAVLSTDDPAQAGWRFPRHNYIFGRLTRATGWYPDYQTRLLRVGRAHYDPEKIVHEVVLLDGELGTLENPLIHYNYEDMAHFGEKQRKYSHYDAQILYAQGVQPKAWSFLSMPIRHFIWRFFTLKGYQDGVHGLLLSLLMARYEFRKYWLLMGFWRQGSAQ